MHNQAACERLDRAEQRQQRIPKAEVRGSNPFRAATRPRAADRRGP